MCVSPIVLKRTDGSPFNDYKTNKVPCGKCVICLKRRSDGWTFRLMEQAKDCYSVAYLTFTHEDGTTHKSPNNLDTLHKKDFQLFMKRLRKKTHRKIKYYACGEYGDEYHRPHYHAIMYNLPLKWIEDTERKVLTNTWEKGFVHKGDAVQETMAYVSKYIMKGKYKQYDKVIDENTGEVFTDDREPEFSIMSKGLGKNFLTPQMVKYLKDSKKGYVDIGGFKTALPRYFRDKVYTNSEKRELTKLAQIHRENKFKDHPDEIIAEHEYVMQTVLKHEKSKLINKRNLKRHVTTIQNPI